MTITVSVIGAGRIGGAVIACLKGAPGFRLGRVLTRSGGADPASFLATPADIIIDAAGPEALRSLGADCLRTADLWTVGAAALIDDALHARLEATARAAGTRLRLFAPWGAGLVQLPAGQATGLTLRISRPGSGATFCGPLRAAAARFPDELNFAMAAALCGPGVEATQVEMRDGAPHRLQAELETTCGSFRSSVSFTGQGPHPTAQSLIAALERLGPGISCGA